jgi:hypothetical protein
MFSNWERHFVVAAAGLVIGQFIGTVLASVT